MIAMFKVTYFDPKRGNFNMESITVIAANAADAIRKADAKKAYKYFRAESVALISVAD